MSEARKSSTGYSSSLMNGEHMPWLQSAPPSYYNNSFHFNNAPGQMERSTPYQSRMMPLDLSYQNPHHVTADHSIYSGNGYYSPAVSSPCRPTYFDMDTGQQSYLSPMNGSSRPPPAARHAPISRSLPVSRLPPPTRALPMSQPQPPPRASPPQLSLEMPRLKPAAAHQSPKSLPSELTSPRAVLPAAKFKCADSTAEVSSGQTTSKPSVPTASLDKTFTPADTVSAANDSDMEVEVIGRSSPVATETEKVKTSVNKDFLDSDTVSSHSRSRRPVERYQIIHNYRGRKNNFSDVIGKRHSGVKPRKKPAKQKLSQNMADTLSDARKLTNDLLNSVCIVNKTVIPEEQLTKTVMVPDSTTEPLSTSSSSGDLQMMMAEQLAKTISGLPQVGSKPRSLDISPCKVLLGQSSTTKPPPGLTPSQTSPTLFKALTSKLPSIDNDVQIIKRAEKVKQSTVKSSSTVVSKSPEVLPETTSSPKPSTSPEDKPVEPESTITGTGRRRRICQTDFYQIIYPQPKRRKSVDSQRPAPKSKVTRQGESATPTPHKGWKGKSNLSVAIDSTSKSTDSSPVKPQEQQKPVEADSQALDIAKKTPVPKENQDKEVEELMEGGRTIGRIVWARLTARCKAWPAMTIKGASAAQSPASTDNQWVFWYGEHKVSEVQICRLQDFDIEFKACFKSGSGALYTSAVMEALKDCWTKLNVSTDDKSTQETIPEGLEKLIEWSESIFTPDKPLLPTGKVTKAVGERLADIVEMINNADESSDESDNEVDKDYEVKRRSSSSKSKKVEEVTVRKPNPATRVKAVSRVKTGELDLETICLSCGDEGGLNLQAHPLFNGGVCEECLEHVKDSFFSFGADGCMSYCVLCGQGGELLVCDSQTCGRTYCNQCIEVLGSEELLNDIKESDPWACFLCKPISSNGILIQNRDDWKQRLMRFYQKPSKLHNLPECKPDRKLRVMSLFDGIGTAKVVLDNLNLDVEVYYSLEIEEDAIQVINLNHGDNVIQLGDIRSLTEEKLASLGRIDLLVGGSPCNDLALVNPARKGLYDATGTGILFFDFYRILMTLMSRQSNHSVLWLFENVVHMNKETKETISRFLECEPVKLDAGVFSAQSRSRYFWGNIPGMFCPVSPEMMSVNIRLQDVLSKGREAAVSKIRTVTTRGASLLQGRNEDQHAVVMNGQSDKLWPTELERVFGLPVHYTDAGNLAPGKRQKLLGRSWCVPVIEHLLKPLTHLFAVKQSDKSKQQCSCSCGAKK